MSLIKKFSSIAAESFSAASKKVNETGSEALSKLSAVKEMAGEKVSEAGSKAGEKLSEARKFASGKMSEACAMADGKMSEAKVLVGEKLSDAKLSLADVSGKVSEWAKTCLDTIEDYAGNFTPKDFWDKIKTAGMSAGQEVVFMALTMYYTVAGKIKGQDSETQEK